MAGKGHVGKAGQLAAMAEFLLRGYNVAMPEVDLGDDIFVVHDVRGQLWRVQVKTAVGKPTEAGYRGTFSVSRRQLRESKEPDLFYVLALREGPRWDFLVVSRIKLYREQKRHGAGSIGGDNVIFSVHADAGSVTCSGRDWGRWRDDWSEWPPVEGP